MTIQQWITVGILLVAIILFVSEWLTVDLVALVILSLLMLTGILSPIEAVSGFSNSATVTIAAMFVLSAALVKTGYLDSAGSYLSKMLQQNKTRGILVIMIFVGSISAFINNTPVVAVFIPIVLDASQKAKISASRILIVVSFASMFGGLCSLIGTSSNLLVSHIASEHNIDPFGMFEMAPVGLVLFAAGIVYLVLAGDKLIPDRDPTNTLKKRYDIGNYLTDIKLLKGSPSIGTQIANSPIVKDLNFKVVGFGRNSEKVAELIFSIKLEEGDTLRISGGVDQIKEIQSREGIQILKEKEWIQRLDDPENLILAEVLITPGSELEGKSLSQARFKQQFGSFVVAIRSRGVILKKTVDKTILRAGDILLITAKEEVIDNYKQTQHGDDSSFLIISEMERHQTVSPSKAALVFFILLLVVLLPAFNLIPIMASSLMGVTTLVLFRFLDMQEVYKAIKWKIIFLIAGTIGLGVAIEKTQAAALLAEQLIDLFGVFGPVVMISVLYLITSLLTELISNAASAVLLAPLAFSLAETMDVSARPFLLAIMFAASASFMTPVGYQTNTMIYAAGNYRYFDFLRIGLPLNLLFWLLASILIPLYYNL